MLKLFSVKNYRNFKDGVIVNFGDCGEYQYNTDCITNGLIGKMLIYGRNATGKSNLARALMDVFFTLVVSLSFHSNDQTYLNADSEQEYAEFCYVMKFDKDEVIYKYKKNSRNLLIAEQLSVNDNNAFNVDYAEGNIEVNLDLIPADSIVMQRYKRDVLETMREDEDQERELPFFRWVISNVALSDDSPIQLAFSFIRRMSVMGPRNLPSGNAKMMASFYEYLSKGNNLEKYERFLNTMGVSCKLAVERMPEGQYQLYFKHDRLIPFNDTASSGTIMLNDFYRRYIAREGKPSFMFLDEFDAHCHYEMAYRLVEYLKNEYHDTQIILTTHNTNLMMNRLMRPDCLFILSRSGILTSLNRATNRELREGHNLEKMYISGEFHNYE